MTVCEPQRESFVVFCCAFLSTPRLQGRLRTPAGGKTEMKSPLEFVLVCAPTKGGEHFIKMLKIKGIRVAGLTNNSEGKARLEELGVENNILVDTRHQKTWSRPPFPVSRVYLFENSFTLCCRYIQMCRAWTSQPIVVITTSLKPRLVYTSLGASYVIYSYSGEAEYVPDRTAEQE